MGKRKRISNLKFKKNSKNIIFIKKIRISPRKIRVMLNLIKYKNVFEAINILKFNNKKCSKILIKGIFSCINNINYKKTKYIYNIYISQVDLFGMYKRFIPVSRGKSHIIRKKISVIKIGIKKILK
ncbi:MAG: uL22 family ribosomal protein [Candidatus Shikimatogenerans sp. Ttur]|uniref:50S ribosomal protein L22 n=1 Tax=Candidatus Shikimatogenerans sp. Ttur TaxID=3158569 RepID=A0AAU7ZXL5_9FLAO